MTPDNQPQAREWPCSHIKRMENRKKGTNDWHYALWKEDGLEFNWVFVGDNFSVCPNCKAERPRPEEAKDGLDEIWEKHDKQYGSANEWRREMKKAIRAWKEKDTSLLHKMQNILPNFITAGAGLAVRKEEPKLWEILFNHQVNRGGIEEAWQEKAKTAIEAVEKKIDELCEFYWSSGFSADVKKKIRELL